MTQLHSGWLEIDHERGVIYFHLADRSDMHKNGGVTKLRICSLPTPIPEQGLLDITYGHGVSWLYTPWKKAEEGGHNGESARHSDPDTVAGSS